MPTFIQCDGAIEQTIDGSYITCAHTDATVLTQLEAEYLFGGAVSMELFQEILPHILLALAISWGVRETLRVMSLR